MLVPHWWSRDRSSCRHLWYPITGLRRNTPRIVHLPASVLENGASRPWHALARVSVRTLDFRVYAKVAVNTGFDDLRRGFASIQGGNERSIATTTGCSTQATYLLYEQKNAEWPRNRWSRVLSAIPLNSVHREYLYRSMYRSIDTDHSPKKCNRAPGARLEFTFGKSLSLILRITTDS